MDTHRKLCRGYEAVSLSNAEKPSDAIGTFYAVYPDGRVYSTAITLAQYRTHTFAFKGADWKSSELTPEHVAEMAEFNGNYEFPVM